MSLGEFGRIERFFRPLAAGVPGALGLADDAAVLPVADVEGLAVSTDALVEGVHFRAADPPEAVARKALRVNLSDMAAMGAAPWVYTLALALAPCRGDLWVERLAAGLAEDGAAWNIALVGGDSVRAPGPAMLSVTMFGRAPPGGALTRAGARPGDDIWVSGTLGDAALGLRLLEGGLGPVGEADAAFLADRYRLPRPRVALGAALAGRARAAIDVSDGLAQDLGHLCRASGVAARVRFEDLPLSAAARRLRADGRAAAADIAAGGDDYELLFAARPEDRAEVLERARRAGTPVARIGKAAAGEGVVLLDGAGREIALESGGWRHA